MGHETAPYNKHTLPVSSEQRILLNGECEALMLKTTLIRAYDSDLMIIFIMETSTAKKQVVIQLLSFRITQLVALSPISPISP